jgi:hypothetical protein
MIFVWCPNLNCRHRTRATARVFRPITVTLPSPSSTHYIYLKRQLFKIVNSFSASSLLHRSCCFCCSSHRHHHGWSCCCHCPLLERPAHMLVCSASQSSAGTLARCTGWKLLRCCNLHFCSCSPARPRHTINQSFRITTW